jgi:hypothetical protein
VEGAGTTGAGSAGVTETAGTGTGCMIGTVGVVAPTGGVEGGRGVVAPLDTGAGEFVIMVVATVVEPVPLAGGVLGGMPPFDEILTAIGSAGILILCEIAGDPFICCVIIWLGGPAEGYK